MKKFIVGMFALTTLATVTSQGGPVESTYQQAQTYQPSQEWFQDREWNFDLFGARADTYNEYRNDQYLGVDHAYGGGIDVNYMFTRFLGAGFKGYALDADRAIVGLSGDLIFRYPIPGTRFAPYGFAGGGVIFNGSRVRTLVSDGRSPASIREHSSGAAVGDFGVGFEVRITPTIGVINDYSYNLVDGPNNNFGIIRSGIRFAF